MDLSLVQNLIRLSPEICIVVFLVLLFTLDSVFPKTRENKVPFILVAVGCLIAGGLTYWVSLETPSRFFYDTLANDSFSAFFRYVFFFSGAAAAYLSYGSKDLTPPNRMEFCLLLLCVIFGMCLMATSTNLLILYMGIETVSIISFILAGFKHEDLRSNEASFKYFVFGALASSLMVYGFSWIYGITGSLNYTEIAVYLQANHASLPVVLPVSLLLIYAGLAYKISAFPMHFWTPDVYEGSPTPVATFFSVAPKAAGFAAFIRFFLDVLTVKGETGTWQLMGGESALWFLAILSAVTMTVGNLSAIGQTSTKRMLAYSSIAHVGYMLMGLLTLEAMGLGAILFYIIAYCATNFGAFWVISVVSDIKGSDKLDAFRGTGWSMPVLGVTMTIFLASLAGIPMFSGFIGKLLLFGSIVKSGSFMWLAILGVLNSVVSMYYYAKILREMWLEGPEASRSSLSLYNGIALVGLAIPTVVMGLWFTPVLRFVESSIASIL